MSEVEWNAGHSGVPLLPWTKASGWDESLPWMSHLIEAFLSHRCVLARLSSWLAAQWLFHPLHQRALHWLCAVILAACLKIFLKLHFTPTFVLLFLFFFQSFPSTKVVPKYSRGTFGLRAYEGKWKEKKNRKKNNFCLVYSTGGPCCVMCKISDISLIHLAKIQQKHFLVSLMFALISLVASKTKSNCCSLADPKKTKKKDKNLLDVVYAAVTINFFSFFLFFCLSSVNNIGSLCSRLIWQEFYVWVVAS